MTVSLEYRPARSIPATLVEDVRNGLAYVDPLIMRVERSADAGALSLALGSECSAERRQQILQRCERVVSDILKHRDATPPIVLENFADRATPYRGDPMIDLVAARELTMEGPGVYTLGPALSHLMLFFDARLERIASALGAQPYHFPALIAARNLERLGYFKRFPHSLSFVTHLQEDLDAIENFARNARCNGHQLCVPHGVMDQVEMIPLPAACYHLYFHLADRPLARESVVATSRVTCFRYESSNLLGLRRLWNFTVRELMFVGSEDLVLRSRERALELVRDLFDELELAYRVETANDPFFPGEETQQARLQRELQLKWEVRARLPFDDSTLAVGSYNYHMQYFGRTLNITGATRDPVHTGCVGFGLERLAYAFLAQFGPHPAAWPRAVRDGIARAQSGT